MTDILGADEARVNITFGGQNADLPQTVSRFASPADVKRWVEEALRTGSVPGMPAVAGNETFDGFTVDPLMEPIEGRPYAMFAFRPQTKFGTLPRKAPSKAAVPGTVAVDDDEVSEDLIEVLRDALQLARKGKIVACALVTVSAGADQNVTFGWSFSTNPRLQALTCGLAALQRDLIRRDFDVLTEPQDEGGFDDEDDEDDEDDFDVDFDDQDENEETDE